jgi:hypothetical protein
LSVRLADGMTAPARGTAVVLEGILASPYGQLELRLVASGLTASGPGAMPEIRPIGARDLGEASEGWLVGIDVTISARPTRATSGDLGVQAMDFNGGALKLYADASTGLTAGNFVKGRTYSVTGIVGQRATRKGALDGYRIWIRDRADLEALAAEPTPSPVIAPIQIRQALAREESEVLVEGMVTAGPELLDSTGRRIVIADPSGAIEVMLPAGESARVGEWLRVAGEVGRAWGAPRILAGTVERIDSRGSILPVTLQAGPGPAHEWRLVRVSGTVTDVKRLGSTWRAELSVGGERVVIAGLAGAGIASTALVEGRPATVIGIVRRPYPSASDRRYQVVPREPTDIALGPAGSGGGSAGGGRSTGIPNRGGSSSATAAPGPIDVDLATLAEHLGERVRVGGLVVAPTADGFTLDDSTAEATIVLADDAADFIGLLEPGDAVNATGTVERRDGRLIVVVRTGAGLVRIGDLGQALPIETTATPEPSPTARPQALAGFGSAGPDPSVLGLAGILAVSALSAVVTLIRRRRLAQQVAIATRTRLASLTRDDRSA